MTSEAIYLCQVFEDRQGLQSYDAILDSKVTSQLLQGLLDLLRKQYTKQQNNGP